MPEHYPNALPAGHRIEEYEIIRVLGAGGFGITYLAFDHNLDGSVALKEYFPADVAVRADGHRVVTSASEHADVFTWGLERFIEEARAVHRFKHQNVVRAHRYFDANDTAYLVMEHVEGESLAAVLNRHDRLTPAQWKPWLDALLDGLAHVHAQGYLHRDIKPSNIVIRAADVEPVLIDFGSARILAAERTHTQVLTRAYAPIEQHSSKAEQGSFTDIYSLAAVSYRALTGESPPSAPARMLDGQYEPLVECVDDVDRAWLAAIDHGLAVLPDDRPPTVAAWGSALADSLGDAQCLAKWVQRAADHGDVVAQFNLGCMYESGEGLPQDYATAATWYRKAADRGEADAQFNLGCLHDSGKGVAQDYAQAAAWYRMAADQGHADAQFNLAHLYLSGQGVPKDYVQAAVWLREAADQGDENSQGCLDGKAVPPDFAQVAALYRDAVDQAAADAQCLLGGMYASGEGVPQDHAKAVAWFRKAAAQRHAAAEFWLWFCHRSGLGVPQDNARAEAWLHRSADHGNASAQFLIAMGYRSGKNVPQDDVQAEAWLRRAADQEHALAQCELGDMYTSGSGVPRDLVRAHMWFTVANATAAASNIESAPKLQQKIEGKRQTIEAGMSPSEIAEATHRARTYMESNNRDCE